MMRFEGIWEDHGLPLYVDGVIRNTVFFLLISFFISFKTFGSVDVFL